MHVLTVDCVSACGTINLTLLVMGTLNVVFTQRGCGFFPLKRRTMKKLNKVALLLAAAAMAGGAVAQTRVGAADGGNRVDNWVNGDGTLVWMNGTRELCWRDAFWTPATAAKGCDGALVVQAPAPAPVAAPEPPPAPKA